MAKRKVSISLPNPPNPSALPEMDQEELELSNLVFGGDVTQVLESTAMPTTEDNVFYALMNRI